MSPTPISNERRICFPVTATEKKELDILLPHGTQGKLFTTIAVSLIPMLQERKREILGGLLSGEIVVELKLKLKEKKS